VIDIAFRASDLIGVLDALGDALGSDHTFSAGIQIGGYPTYRAFILVQRVF